MLQSLLDRLFVLFQRTLPQHRLGRAVHALTRNRTPWVRTLLIRTFVRFYGVDLSEVDNPHPAAFEHMNAFFTRPLRAGARPIAPGAGTVVSPSDGTLEEMGYAHRDHLLQAKQFQYRLAAFLALDEATAERFHDGATATIYLAPHDYHRVHMPLAARIREMVYVPGRRWAVNRRTARAVPDLFASNERVILRCEAAGGDFNLVLVGALNVASVSLAWSGEIPSGDQVRRIVYPDRDPSLQLAAGDLVGQFNLGSTVILVADRGLITWDSGRQAGVTTRMGERLGQAGR